jgi:hypothetical protein
MAVGSIAQRRRRSSRDSRVSSIRRIMFLQRPDAALELLFLHGLSHCGQNIDQPGAVQGVELPAPHLAIDPPQLRDDTADRIQSANPNFALILSHLSHSHSAS